MPDLFDNRYRYKNDLRKGGCGRVFLAEEEESKHLVAIKQLNNRDKKSREPSFTKCKSLPGLTIQTLLGTCKLAGVNPTVWFTDVLNRLPEDDCSLAEG